MSITPFGCGDDPAEGRPGPEHPEGFAMFRRDLIALRDWLSRDWLCAPEAHPLRALWRRDDQAASLELQSVAGAIQCIVPKAGPSLSRQWLDGIRSADVRTMRTTLFELYAAGLFAHSTNVRTVRAKQPGYDFALDFEGGKEARVSCKSREMSDDELRAARFARELRERIRVGIPNGPAIGVQLFSPKSPPAWIFDAERVFPRVRAAVRAVRLGRPDPPNPDDDWRIEAGIHDSRFPPLVFRADRLSSLSFSLFVGVTLDYQRLVEGFRQKILDAIANVARHSDANDSRTNIIVYRIPQQLAVDDAATAVRDAFATSSSERVACVFFYRAGYYTVDNATTFYLGHEWWEVKNDRATTPLASVLPGGTLALEPFGGKRQEVEPVQVVTEGSRQFPVAPGFWVRLHGEHHYRMPDWAGNGGAIRRPFGLAITFSTWHQIVNAPAMRLLTDEIPADPTLL